MAVFSALCVIRATLSPRNDLYIQIIHSKYILQETWQQPHHKLLIHVCHSTISSCNDSNIIELFYGSVETLTALGQG